MDRKFLWGEIDNPGLSTKTNPSGLTTAEKEMLMRLPKSLLLEGPRLCQPQKPNPEPITKEEPKVSITRLGVEARERIRSGGDIDEKFILPEKRYDIFNQFPNPDEDTFPPKRLQYSPISQGEAKRRLRKSVAEILAFVGYKEASKEALNVLADVTSEFLGKFTQKLSAENERWHLGKPIGYADVLDRVLAEFRLPSVLGLQNYFQFEIRQTYENILNECQNSQTPDTPELKSSGLYFAPGSSQDDNIPEIHFPSSEEGYIDHTTPQLETGLQMLQSLEQGSLGSHGPPTVQEDDGPLSHDSNSALLLATVSPGLPDTKRRKKM